MFVKQGGQKLISSWLSQLFERGSGSGTAHQASGERRAESGDAKHAALLAESSAAPLAEYRRVLAARCRLREPTGSSSYNVSSLPTLTLTCHLIERLLLELLALAVTLDLVHISLTRQPLITTILVPSRMV